MAGRTTRALGRRIKASRESCDVYGGWRRREVRKGKGALMQKVDAGTREQRGRGRQIPGKGIIEVKDGGDGGGKGRW